MESLPGVGRKTANVVLNMWWGMPTQAVDTHIFRVGFPRPRGNWEPRRHTPRPVCG
ncbi:MAG: hypothetical protein AAFV38_10950 [Pseudomonadota bacterium]